MQSHSERCGSEPSRATHYRTITTNMKSNLHRTETTALLSQAEHVGIGFVLPIFLMLIYILPFPPYHLTKQLMFSDIFLLLLKSLLRSNDDLGKAKIFYYHLLKNYG